MRSASLSLKVNTRVRPLNRRGRRVRAALIGALVVAIIYALSALIWYTDDGYCIGTLAACVDL